MTAKEILAAWVEQHPEQAKSIQELEALIRSDEEIPEGLVEDTLRSSLVLLAYLASDEIKLSNCFTILDVQVGKKIIDHLLREIGGDVNPNPTTNAMFNMVLFIGIKIGEQLTLAGMRFPERENSLGDLINEAVKQEAASGAFREPTMEEIVEQMRKLADES